MSRWHNFINAGLDPADCDSDVLRRARSVQGAALLMLGASVAIGLQALSSGDTIRTALAAFAGLCVAATATWLTHTQRVGVAGHALVLGLFVALCAFTPAMGGFHDSSFGWTYTLPLCGALMISRPAAWGWAGIAIATQAVFWSQDGSQGLSPGGALELFAPAAITLVVGALAHALIEAQRHPRERMRVANLKLKRETSDVQLMQEITEGARPLSACPSTSRAATSARQVSSRT